MGFNYVLEDEEAETGPETGPFLVVSISQLGSISQSFPRHPKDATN